MSSNLETAPILGIDLGTTNSLVAVVENGKPHVLLTEAGDPLVPSVISFKNGQPVVGAQAKADKIRDASTTVFSVKRLLGREFADVKTEAEKLPFQVVSGAGVVRVLIGKDCYTVIELSAMILSELKRTAEHALKTKVSRAVITVPAYFDDSQRQATRLAGRLAGLDVVRIVNEPTAASLAYGLVNKKNGIIAVYDFGGGTFDVSILKLQDGIFEVLATHGDTALGGDDLDQVIATQMSKEIREKLGIDVWAEINLKAELIEKSERLKIQLSYRDQVDFEMSFGQKGNFKRSWTYTELESVLSPVIELTRGPCERALKDAGLTKSEITDVVMVGGPTRLLLLQKFCEQIFERKPNTSMHPDQVVAEGAAIQADILAGNNRELLLLDVVPLSLGMETYGGLMSVFIPRNSRIPTAVKETFTTFVDNQTGVDIHILQGERDRAEDCRSLAKFKLKGIPPMPAGMARVEVNFMVDADGILQVAARDQHTGQVQAIEVRPSYGLSETEIQSILNASYEHAAEDIEFRQYRDARNDAEPTLRGAESRLEEAKRLLTESEVALIVTKIEELKNTFELRDPKKIKEAQEALNQSTLKLADLLIKEKITHA